MPKVNNIIMDGTQGSLQGLTFVKSRRYGHHVRSRRGTIKPAPINTTLEQCKDRLQKASGPAGLIFSAVRNEHKDGGLWSRLLSIFNKRIKDGLQIDVSCIADLECSVERKMDTLLSGSGFVITVDRADQVLKIVTTLKNHPHWESGSKFLDGYQMSLVIIFPDFISNQIQKEVVSAPISSFKESPGIYNFEVPVPAWAKEYAIFMKFTACTRGRLEIGSTTQGMRVVNVGLLETR